MPTCSLTKPIKVTNGKARVSISLTETGADLLERAAAAKGVTVTTYVHQVAMREAREAVGYLATEVGK